MRKREKVSMKVMVIVHGLSEYCICKNIQSNLRLKQEIIARDKGKVSIQINGLMNLLNKDKRFSTFNSFIRNFPDIKIQNKKLVDFRLFIIMDVDDCDKDTKRKFIDKSLFRQHWAL